MDTTNNPFVHIGAVYFRKSAPPKEDWERDYRQAKVDGHTMFRHWFCWNAIEVAPDIFDWEDYDKQLDLAAQYGIDTIIAEMLVDTPEWLYHKYPHARIEKADGTKRSSEMHGSCATGGHYCMCLDNKEVELAAEHFLTALAARYKDHPGLKGYDIWNEATLYDPNRFCYCPATQERFREWLKLKYKDIKVLGKAWGRYSLTDWDQAELPRTFELYPEVFDAIAFWNDNAFNWMKWRRNVIKKVDQKHLVVSHGNSRSFNDIATSCGDDWRAAQQSDVFGYTYYYGISCHPFMAGDIIRSASKGKEFWRAEAIGNSTWSQRTSINRYQSEKDQMSIPENIRLDFMLTLAAGGRGYITPRWRPLLDGPLFGAFGWYGMDGSTTERSEMIASLAKWCNNKNLETLWKAKPVKGEVAILILEEAQIFGFIQSGINDFYNHYYGQCIKGAYEALLDANIQCDFVRMEDIGDYDLIYVPYPVAIPDDKMKQLGDWINQGGNLVAEGCYGYFNGRGHAHTVQPNRGFEEIFGCKEKVVSFAPDRWDTLTFSTSTTKEENTIVGGALYRQEYEVTTGTPVGYYEDGSIACVEHQYGKGSIRITGTMPSYSYKKAPTKSTQNWFSSILNLADKKQNIKVNQKQVIARLWKDENDSYLWIVNQDQKDLMVEIKLDTDCIKYKKVSMIKGQDDIYESHGLLTLEVLGRDASIVKLEQ